MNEKSRNSTPNKEKNNREKILKAAATIFARKGYSATIEQIADHIGISKGNIYYYFDSKQSILFQLFKQAMVILNKSISAIDEKAPADLRLKKILKTHIKILCSEKDLMTVIMDHHRELLPEQWDKIVALRNAYEKKLQSILKEGIDKGFFLPYDEKILSYSMLGSVNWCYTWYNPEGPLEPEEIAEIFSEHLIKGVRRVDNIENNLGMCIDEISVGDSASFSKTINAKDIYIFAGVTGDFNPIHINEDFAQSTPFGTRIAHGGITISLVAPVLGTILPGLGTIVMETNCKFKAPVYPGDTVTATAKVIEKIEEKNQVIMELTWINQYEKLIASGHAVVLPPSKQLKQKLNRGEHSG